MISWFTYECDCGYSSNICNIEKDSPFSSVEIWVFNGFFCKSNEVEKRGFLTFEDAALIAEAECPECRSKLFKKT